jgi:hypothetical protein
MTTLEIYLDENTTMIYPLLRQDLIEVNTTISVIEDVLQDNKTDTNETISSSTVFNEVIHINSTNMTDMNEFQSSSVPIMFHQTTDQVEPTTSIIPLDYTNTTEDHQTNGWNLLFNDSFTVTISDELIINSNISQKDAILPNQDINLNETELIFIETNSNSNETSILSSKSISIPICDHSCQCLKECPYGFEIVNDTCSCNPPCKVSNSQKKKKIIH